MQFNRYFTFKQAREQISYLDRLGVSDLYASPYFKAQPDSLHGYDIANHNELSPAIGTPEEYEAMVKELHHHAMYQVLDTVPNHMGIGEQANTWWMDVLENGRSSVYAEYFDIDWNPINIQLTNKVLLPILGEQYGTVLENKELQVRFLSDEGRFVLRYYDRVLPISPRSYEELLSPLKDQLVEKLGPDSQGALEFQSILTSITHLPSHFDGNPSSVLERSREKEVVKRRLAALCATEPAVLEAIQKGLEAINGTAGDPHSFDNLDALIDHQPYRLSFWRVAGEEINYRRFFDVNELAAIRVDQPQVFRETHRLIMELLSTGKLNGVRIDHIDGLRNPAGYLHDLQRGFFLAVAGKCIERLGIELDEAARREAESRLGLMFDEERAADPGSVLNKPLYVVVEKILGRGEKLHDDWEAYGTTGYEFTNAVNGLFVRSDTARAFNIIYEDFIRDKINFADLAYNSKKQIMRVSLSSEVNVLTNMLNHIAQNDRHSRDFTLSSIRNAIREVIACFPVYRTYITPGTLEVDKGDRASIETAVSRAKKRNPDVDPSIFNFLQDILLLRSSTELTEAQTAARFEFVMKFQQVTGPVTAKGIEDTAFYNYNRLISLNEVGGEPAYFGLSTPEFHRIQEERARLWPHSILTTSTHDTKRSEDVRARISVLSEMPKEWRAAVKRWAWFNRKLKKTVDGQKAPDANEEYFLYQTLLGVWPFESDIPEDEYEELISRVQAYMSKAMNEAKVNTSWVNPNEAYQEAVKDFIAAILKRGEGNRFLPNFLAFQRKVAFYGAFNSLAQVLIKITSPGVPDIYQGTELWDLSLVDPDNRRPVDYGKRRKLLGSVEKIKTAKGAAALLDTLESGAAKLYVTSKLLRFRRDNPDLFAEGTYQPLAAEGKLAENIVAYARTLGDRTAITVAPCLVAGLGRGTELLAPVGEIWTGNLLPLPEAEVGEKYTNILTGEVISVQSREGLAVLPLEQVLGTFPVALLVKESI